MTCGILCVPQSEVYVIEQFGKYVRVAEPGLGFYNICACELPAGAVSLRVKQLDVQCETKTRDNVFVIVSCSVQFQVKPEDVYSAFYKLANPSGQITSYVYDVLRSTVPKLNLDSVFESKDEIALALKQELSATMSSYGFKIINALVTDIAPNAVVKQSMNEINAAMRIRQAASEKGEAEKILVVKAAEAQSESAYLAGVGIARQRQAIIQGLQDSMTTFSGKMHDVSGKDVMQLMLMTQYMDTLRDIGNNGNSNTLFVHHSPSAVGDLTAQIRDALVHSAPPRQDMERAAIKSNQIMPFNGQEPR